MLDTETKRKIDSARDILVGKVPDPKAQVEQITTALIYKFMDDMDREAEELGGKAKFITGELEAYQWANLMSKELSGEARLNLYMSALLVFSKAQNIPDIFRTIFKDAFLPYRDPETLNLFLKQIDYFDYDHSENLGNAFEYLLSVLGSQGDAGQFRTPRHIIDFIVEIIEPKKTDTILDPSCGTAGFLISAYKHILANETLTPEDKRRLMENFTGYDISPDMVRLSLVNLYLHSFPSPKVYEYDTLTSEDRWDESYNIILANPPFMTPKGGIRPHSRFSVQAKRSEVLFVDYIAEHLNLNGKAGIIVPEGIIFQSANAYKALRKMLVDKGFLWAVVSLPAGVFQPYSGVKTSILLLDRAIAKQHDSILFIKINQDGFDLGAQRRENTHSELPIALELLKTYRNNIIRGENNTVRPELVEGRFDKLTANGNPNPMVQVVLKTKIAETGDYNLTGERYRETVRHDGIYPMVRLGDICLEIRNGKNVEQFDEIGKYRVTRIQTISHGFVDLDKTKWTNDKVAESDFMQIGDILLSHINSFDHLGKSALFNFSGEKVVHGINLIRYRFNKNFINPKFANTIFKSVNFIDNVKKYAQKAVNQASVKVSDLSKIEIPLPPLEIQNAIVAEIEQWQKVIDGAKQVIANYRPTITINPDWKMVKLGDVCNIKTGKLNSNAAEQDGIYPFFTCSKEVFKINTFSFDCEAVLLSGNNAAGNYDVKYYNGKFNAYQRTYVITVKEEFINNLNYALLRLIVENNLLSLKNQSVGGLTKYLTLGVVENIQIPLPAIETQNTLVEQIEKERAAVDACKTLVALFEAKIKTKIAEVWGVAE